MSLRSNSLSYSNEMSKTLFVSKCRAVTFTTFALGTLAFWSTITLYQYIHRPRESPGEKFWQQHLAPEYCALLNNDNYKVFLLEPYLLAKVYSIVGTIDQPEADAKWQDLQWRFNLPQEWHWKANSLTVGVFDKNWKENVSKTIFSKKKL